MDLSPPLFKNRTEAGRRLAERLATEAFGEVAVYALPRGGVPVATEIASALRAPLDLLLVRKVGAPGNPELALGAVVDGEPPGMVVNEDVARMLGVDDGYLHQAAARELAEIGRRRRLYLQDRPRVDPRGKTAIVVDDGLATGATARAAVRSLRQQGAAHIILAAPVASREAAADLRRETDRLVCLAEPANFMGVGAWYADFHQLDDAEVIGLLAGARSGGTSVTG